MDVPSCLCKPLLHVISGENETPLPLMYLNMQPFKDAGRRLWTPTFSTTLWSQIKDLYSNKCGLLEKDPTGSPIMCFGANPGQSCQIWRWWHFPVPVSNQNWDLVTHFRLATFWHFQKISRRSVGVSKMLAVFLYKYPFCVTLIMLSCYRW